MIELKVNGQTYSGWKSASVRRSLNAFASSADFTVSDYKLPRNIPLDAPCQVLMNGIPVITGYIDQVTPSYDASTHEVAISMRSKTADLVDCSAIFDTGQIMNSDIQSIIETIIAPFGINLRFLAQGSFSVPDFQLQQGETASSAIERLCAMYNLVFFDDAEGSLVIIYVDMGPSVGSLIHKIGAGSERNNILSGSCEYSRRDIFREYIVKSQVSGAMLEDGAEPASEGRAVDDNVPRFRPIVLLAETGMENLSAQTRAEWERSSRAAKSMIINYTVQGWLNSQGKLWEPGSFVTVDDDEIRGKGKVIVSEVSFSISNSGSTTALRLGLPEAFMPSSAKERINTFTGWEELRYRVKQQ